MVPIAAFALTEHIYWVFKNMVGFEWRGTTKYEECRSMTNAFWASMTCRLSSLKKSHDNLLYPCGQQGQTLCSIIKGNRVILNILTACRMPLKSWSGWKKPSMQCTKASSPVFMRSSETRYFWQSHTRKLKTSPKQSKSQTEAVLLRSQKWIPAMAREIRVQSKSSPATLAESNSPPEPYLLPRFSA